MKRLLCLVIAMLVSPVTYGQQGTLIVLNKSDHTASLIDVVTRKNVSTLPTGTAPHEVAVSADGKLAVVANYGTGQSPGNTLTLLNIAEKRKVKDINLGEYRRPHGIVWLAKQTIAVTTEANKALLLVNIDTGMILHAILTDQNTSHMVELALQSERAFVTNIGSGTTTVIDLKEKKWLTNIETGAGTEGIACSPDGKEIWVTNRAANTVSVIEVASLKVVATLESRSFPIRVKFTPNGKFALVSNAQSGEVGVFDVKERKEVRRLKMEFTPVVDADQRLFGNQFGKSPVPVGILIEPSGTFAFIANTQADIVTMVDLREWKIVDRLVAGKEPDGLGYSKLRVAE
ncbi:MAG: beta-propeller fold lactonase family protein [Ignavibacteriales bacterium]|nr:beta-propeller fold lactonase family protein [Ignavibacteriales bacterium]